MSLNSCIRLAFAAGLKNALSRRSMLEIDVDWDYRTSISKGKSICPRLAFAESARRRNWKICSTTT